MKYQILDSNGQYQPYITESESADFIAAEILEKVNKYSSNYVKVSFFSVRGTLEDLKELRDDILDSLKDLIEEGKCHLGNFVKFEVEKDCEGSLEYAEYDLISKDERGCSLTLEIA